MGSTAGDGDGLEGFFLGREVVFMPDGLKSAKGGQHLPLPLPEPINGHCMMQGDPWGLR